MGASVRVEDDEPIVETGPADLREPIEKIYVFSRRQVVAEAVYRLKRLFSDHDEFAPGRTGMEDIVQNAIAGVYDRGYHSIEKSPHLPHDLDIAGEAYDFLVFKILKSLCKKSFRIDDKTAAIDEYEEFSRGDFGSAISDFTGIHARRFFQCDDFVGIESRDLDAFILARIIRHDDLVRYGKSRPQSFERLLYDFLFV